MAACCTSEKGVQRVESLRPPCSFLVVCHSVRVAQLFKAVIHIPQPWRSQGLNSLVNKEPGQCMSRCLCCTTQIWLRPCTQQTLHPSQFMHTLLYYTIVMALRVALTQPHLLAPPPPPSTFSPSFAHTQGSCTHQHSSCTNSPQVNRTCSEPPSPPPLCTQGW